MGKLNRTMSILPTYAGGRPGGGQQPEVSVAGLVWHETTNCPSWSRGAQASGCSAGLHKGITSTSQGGGPQVPGTQPQQEQRSWTKHADILFLPEGPGTGS